MKPKKIAKMPPEKEVPGHATKFRLVIRPSGIQGQGVFAVAPIPAHKTVIEYTGARLSPRQMRVRIEHALRQKKKPPRYIFRLDRYWRLDGAIGGSGAERINHSCDPNLIARKKQGRIVFVSLRRIHRGEELTLDYKYHPKSPPMACRCGSPNCRGSINLTLDQWKEARKRASVLARRRASR